VGISRPESQPSAGTRTSFRELLDRIDLLDANDSLPTLLHLDGEAAGSIHFLHEASDRVMVAGRNHDTDIHIPDSATSEKHFEIHNTCNGCVIHDLDSKNGTFINGRRLKGKKLLKDLDRITAGNTTLLFLAGESPEKNERSFKTRPDSRVSAGALEVAAVLAAVACTIVLVYIAVS
jgi:hypothetical protein